MKGACLCGGFKFEVNGEPGLGGACHCTRCQRLSGGGYTAGFIVAADQFQVLEGAEHDRAYAEEGHSTRHFCSNCGSSTYVNLGDRIIVLAGGLEPGSGFTIGFHMMTDFAADWESTGDGKPEFGEYPPME